MKPVKVILNLDVYHNDNRTTVWTREVWAGQMQGGDNNCDPLMLQKSGGLEDGHQLFRLQSLEGDVATYRPVPVARVGWFYKALKHWGFKQRESASGSIESQTSDAEQLAERIATYLFTNAAGQKAKRLVIERESGGNGGGWGFEPARHAILRILIENSDGVPEIDYAKKLERIAVLAGSALNCWYELIDDPSACSEHMDALQDGVSALGDERLAKLKFPEQKPAN